MATQRRTVVWVDASGRTTGTLLTTVAGAAAVQAALEAKSNAAPQAYWEGDLEVTAGPSPVSATFPSTRDGAALVFETASGTLVTVRIPAPVASIFMADGETVDNSQITSIIAQVIADVVTSDGVVITQYVAGRRVRN